MPGQNYFKIKTNWNASRTTFSIHSVHAVNPLANSTALESKISTCYHLVQVSLVKTRLSLTNSTTRAGQNATGITGGPGGCPVYICTAAAQDLHFLIKTLLFHPLDRNANDCQGSGVPQHPPAKGTLEGLFLYRWPPLGHKDIATGPATCTISPIYRG